MPITGTANTQQVIQMSAITDKLQHTLQHLPVTSGQQIQDEQIVQNDLKNIEIQDPENIEKASSQMPGIVEERFNQLQEIEGILEYLNIENTNITTIPKTYNKLKQLYG